MIDTMAQLSPVQQKFVLHWGEMGTRWGINRSVAQIHALLYLSPRPLPAEEIAASLSIARSNVSTSLRELQGWGIVKRVHILGDKRDHFETLSDVWAMFRSVLDERKKRELDPTLAVLRDCLADLEAKPERHTEQRLRALHDFFETATGWYGQLRRLPMASVARWFRFKPGRAPER
jgi:DNA-binding transcriptional regulator GbsR (MarR family)